MLLSLSHDEYESWAKRLSSIVPNEPILQVQRPDVAEKTERGLPWADILIEWCFSCYHPNQDLDHGLYGRAASTLRLCLQNRKALQLDRTRWRTATSAYEGALLSLIVQFRQTMNAARIDDPREIRFIVEEALPLVEEFVGSFPGDQTIERSLGDLKNFLRITAFSAPAVRTYRNEDYGFSLEIPTNWQVEDSRGFFERLFGTKKPPRFVGPNQLMTLDVSPGNPTPDLDALGASFRNAATAAGYRVLSTGTTTLWSCPDLVDKFDCLNQRVATRTSSAPGVVVASECFTCSMTEPSAAAAPPNLLAVNVARVPPSGRPRTR